MLNKEKHIRPDIEGEMEEIQRFSQELSRDGNIEVSVDEVIGSLKKSKEQLLSNSIWKVLENTESNEVEEGDWKTVEKIARGYKKTSPKVLKKEIESGNYKRPLIAKLGDRYILMAGNTRLCTASAMGVNPKVFIANIGDKINETEKIEGGSSDKMKLKPTIITPDPKNVTDDNFIKWYDQKTFGSEVGSLGLKRGTVGKLMQFQEFSDSIEGLQSK